MKFKRIFAAILSVLMLGTMLVFTASAETTPIYVMKAHNGSGFTGEAVTGTKTYDAENDIVYYHYVPKDSTDLMHFGWHGATGAFTWSAPMTVGMIMRTNNVGAVPSIRLCDRDTGAKDSNNKDVYLTISKNAVQPIKGDGTWEVVWFPAATADDMVKAATDQQSKVTNGVQLEYNGLTHVQCFAAGEGFVGNKYLGSDFYFDVAGYAFFNDTVENLADVDLYKAIGVGAPDITLTFDAQNGTEATTATVKNGAYISGKVPFPEAPTAPEGKVFAGWSTDKDAAEGVLEANVPGDSTTYYAIWAQDETVPGDVTLASLKIKGTNAALFGAIDFTADPIVINVPHNWKGDLATELEVTTTDNTAEKTVTAGTFGEGSKVVVKNGSANVTYNIVYKQAAAGYKTFTPTGAVTSNPNPSSAPYKGEVYSITGTRYTNPSRISKNAEIQGVNGTKIEYNKVEELIPSDMNQVDDATKTIKGNANYYTIAGDAYPAFEGGGAYGFVTLSDYPWARVKYYLDPGEDGETVARNFAISTTTWNNGAADKGYAESSKKNTYIESTSQMVAGRWAYAYINLASKFAEDYGFTYQFHFRPYNDSKYNAKNVMEASADDPTVAVPHSTHENAVLFDDAFYVSSVEIFNEFPEEDGFYAQIAPYAGLFTVTDETEINANDGTISGLEVGMEYRLKGADEWIAYEEPALQGEVTLDPGTYEIRYAAIAAEGSAIGWSASPAVEVTIKSALGANPAVAAVNATAVDKNDGKITGVDDAMSYRLAGEESWTSVAEGTTELTNLAPGAYEFIYLADGELRVEDSEITTVYVLVDFDTDHVVYLTNNAEHADEKIYDGSSYDKAYAVTTGEALRKAIVANVKSGESTTFVVIDRIDLGGWYESAASATASKTVFTGLTSDAIINFACCNTAAGTVFAMQHFGYTNELVFENITIDQICLGETEKHDGEQGLGISGNSKVTVADSVKYGPNATRVRIYIPQSTPVGTLAINGGNWEGIYAGLTYYTNYVTSGGDYTITLNDGSVNLISATHHQNIWAGNYTAIVNGGEVRTNLIAGSQSGAYAGDAYVEINDGTVGKLYTTAEAKLGGNNTAATDSGIKNGTAVVVVNGGAVKEFAKGSAAPGGSALIISEDATIPDITGAESDYVIVVEGGGKVEAVLSEAAEYTYQPVVNSRAKDSDPWTATNNGNPITYTASTITGFKVTLPENYNTVVVNGEIVELTDGVLALDALEKDAVNEIQFIATWTLKADINGGKIGYDFSLSPALAEIFGDGLKVNVGDGDTVMLPNSDELIKPYRSGYTLAGWALTADATAEECVTFPYKMTGDTTLYAIWEEANDTPFTADEDDLEDKNYFVYSVENADDFDISYFIQTLGEAATIEKIGAYAVTVMNAETATEDTDAEFSVVYDAKDLDLDGKFLCAMIDSEFGMMPIAMENVGEGKYEFEAVSSKILVFTLDPTAMYELTGTYYAKRNEYVVDIYLDAPAVNAGSIGLEYANMDFVNMTAGDKVQFIESENSDEDENVLITWGVADGEAYVGGEEKVHIATLNFTMTPEQREAYIENGNTIYELIPYEDIPEVCEGGSYLVALHSANDLEVTYIATLIDDIKDTVGPDDMVTVKGTVEMTAREDGVAPIDSNYATLYWRHKGAASWNKVVIEDADTDTSVVEYTLNDVPADTEIEIYVEKNGYLTGKATFTFEAKTEEETEEKPEREADAIELVAGDIKGDYADACGDGKIDIADFVRVLRGLDEEATDEYIAAVDINEDGEATVTDLGFVKANFGEAAE